MERIGILISFPSPVTYIIGMLNSTEFHRHLYFAETSNWLLESGLLSYSQGDDIKVTCMYSS